MTKLEANLRKLARSEGKTYERLRSLKLVDRERNKGVIIEANPFPALQVTSCCPSSFALRPYLRRWVAVATPLKHRLPLHYAVEFSREPFELRSTTLAVFCLRALEIKAWHRILAPFVAFSHSA